MLERERIESLVLSAVREVNSQLPVDERLQIEIDTQLFGDGSKLDSLALVNLVVVVETIVNRALGTSIALADERALSRKNSPFRSVGSLVDYLLEVLGESK